MEQQVRGAADHWMKILRERPAYFPLLMELWAHALREPVLRERLATRFAGLRAATAQIVLTGAERQGLDRAKSRRVRARARLDLP